MEPTKKAVSTFIADEMKTLEESKVLVIREGEAEVIDKPLHNALSGVISAPRAFYDVRKSLHDPNRCHVLVDKNNKSIILIVDEKSKYGYQVSGKITSNPDLLAFGINSKKQYSVKELMQLLKFNRVFFQDKDQNVKVVTALQQFKAKVQTEIQQQNNNRGSQSNVNNINLEHSLQENFILEIPIFNGGEKKTFVVDVCVTVTDGDILLWLESRDLKDLETTESTRLLEDELKTFEGLVIIHQ